MAGKAIVERFLSPVDFQTFMVAGGEKRTFSSIAALPGRPDCMNDIFKPITSGTTFDRQNFVEIDQKMSKAE